MNDELEEKMQPGSSSSVDQGCGDIDILAQCEHDPTSMSMASPVTAVASDSFHQSENTCTCPVSSSLSLTPRSSKRLLCNDARQQHQQHPLLLAESNDILLDTSNYNTENYPTGCTFSPDGTCVLTATSSDGVIRLYDTPFGYYLASNHKVLGDGEDDEVATATTAAVEGNDDDNGGGGFSHNQNRPLGTTTSTIHSTTTTKEETNHHIIQHRHRHHYSWTASLSSHLGGSPPPSSYASYAWYPHMNSTNPRTSFFISCRGHASPIHLIDAYTSQLRASYRPYNTVDEMEGPTVVAFSPDGSKIYGTGFKSDRTIVVFDTCIPGREGLIARLGKTRRSKDGQKGIPSSIAFPKGGGGGDGTTGGSNGGGGCGPFSPNVFAAGTYSPASIYIYDDRMSNHHSSGTIVLHGGLAVVGHGRAFSRKKRRFVDSSSSIASGPFGVNSNNNDDGDDGDGENNNLFSSARVNWFQSRARGGVTQLQWSPSNANNPYVLFSASRRSNVVLSWDVRALSGNEDRQVSRPICGLRSYARDDGDTNQRLQFDIDPFGKQMFVASGGSGGDGGMVKIYDVESGRLDRTLCVENNNGHAVNGVSYLDCSEKDIGNKKFTGLLAVAVGSRQFHYVPSDDDDDDSDIAMRAQKECPGSLQLYGIS